MSLPQVSVAKKLVAAWQKIVEQHRKNDAEEQARVARIAAASAHPALKDLAELNQRLAERRTGPAGLAANILQTTRALEIIEKN